MTSDACHWHWGGVGKWEWGRGVPAQCSIPAFPQSPALQCIGNKIISNLQVLLRHPHYQLMTLLLISLEKQEQLLETFFKVWPHAPATHPSTYLPASVSVFCSFFFYYDCLAVCSPKKKKKKKAVSSTDVINLFPSWVTETVVQPSSSLTWIISLPLSTGYSPSPNMLLFPILKILLDSIFFYSYYPYPSFPLIPKPFKIVLFTFSFQFNFSNCLLNKFSPSIVFFSSL